MRIPHTINVNTITAYKPSDETLALPNEQDRNTFSESFDWDDAFCPSLTALCVNIIVKNFEARQIFHELPLNDKVHLLETLPTTLPVILTVPLFTEEFFWQRAYLERWGRVDVYECDPPIHKTAYIERYLQDYFELKTPEHYDHEEVQTLLATCSPFVTRLWLRQMQQKKPLPSEDIPPKPILDHLNFNFILPYLTNLTEFHLIFGPRDVGIEKFTIPLFKLSMQDCINLGLGINGSQHLKVFKLHRSFLSYDHIKILVQHMVKNETLEEIDVSHCPLGFRGSWVMSQLILHHPCLQIFRLCNDKIDEEGIKGITYALCQPNICPLIRLDLRLNPLGTKGVHTLCSALVRIENTPVELSVAGCDFGEETGERVGEMLAQNKSMRWFDISTNFFTDAACKAIKAGLEINTKLLYLDYRNCGIDAETVKFLKKYLHRNMCIYKKIPYFDEDDDVSKTTSVSEIRQERGEREIKVENLDGAESVKTSTVKSSTTVA